MAKCIRYYKDDKYFIEYAKSDSGEWFKRTWGFNPFIGVNSWSKWSHCGKAINISHETIKYYDKEGDERISRSIIIKFDNSEIHIPYNNKESKIKNRLRLPF